jgi:hypothetical protein
MPNNWPRAFLFFQLVCGHFYNQSLPSRPLPVKIRI